MLITVYNIDPALIYAHFQNTICALNRYIQLNLLLEFYEFYYEMSLVSIVPPKPTFEAKVLNSTSVNVTWTKPMLSEGVPQVDGYILSYNMTSEPEVVQELTPAKLFHVISGLKDSVPYTVILYAKNVVGSSEGDSLNVSKSLS